MGAFRKRDNLSSYRPDGIGSVNTVTVQVSKSVTTKDNPEPTVYVETVEKPVEEYAKSLGLPTDDNYQLRDMLKAGIIPEAVPVSGMLDSQDPTDLANVGVPDALLAKLSDMEPKSKESVSAPASEPSTVEPSND